VDYDVIVAGLGAVGSATAAQLAQRGARVLGLDRFTVPNTQSSHHGRSRVIRQIYFEHPDYVPLLLRAYELWRELEEQSGQKLLTITGGLYVGFPSSPLIRGLEASAQRHELAHDVLVGDETKARFPQFNLPTDVVGIYEQQAGVLDPERCVAAHIAIARQHASTLHEDEPVLDWSSDDGGVSVTTSQRTYRAQQLLLCCGAWANDLLHDAGVKITPTRQVVGWADPTDVAQWASPNFPVWLTELEDGFHYGLPELGGMGVKLSRHETGQAIEPAAMDREPTLEDAAVLEGFLAARLPRLAGTLQELSVCIYENSPDGHFVLDFHPRYRNVLIACGLSGHGFKFAPVLAEALADLTFEGGTTLPVDFLSLARFH